MGPFRLVRSHSQDAAKNVGVLSVYLTNILNLAPVRDSSVKAIQISVAFNIIFNISQY